MGKCLSCCHFSEASSDTNQQKNKQLEISAPTEAIPLQQQPSRPPTLECMQEYHDKTSVDNCSNGLDISANTKPERKLTLVHSGSNRSKSESKRNSHPLGREFSESKLSQLFQRYRDKGEEDVILSDGIESFCRDLDVRPEEFRVLLLAWKFNASQMCQFTRQEFLSGCRCLRADSVNSIKSRFPELLEEVQQHHESFKDLYRFTFRFGLESGQRILPVDMAIQLWRLVFSLQPPPILSSWLQFLEKHPHVRGIPRDTWNMFLNFCEAVGNDLSNYDDTEAWPCLFDDFVEYENDQTNQNVRLCQDREKTENN